jgi:hypothetical protein
MSWVDSVDLTGNWQTAVDYCAGGIPGSEYLWMIVIVATNIVGLAVSRWMVSKF